MDSNGNFSASPAPDGAWPGHETQTAAQAHRDAALDDALRCTFPASDPVALDFVLVRLPQERRPRREHHGYQ